MLSQAPIRLSVPYSLTVCHRPKSVLWTGHNYKQLSYSSQESEKRLILVYPKFRPAHHTTDLRSAKSSKTRRYIILLPFPLSKKKPSPKKGEVCL